MALSYSQLQQYTGGSYKPPSNVNLNSPSVRRPLQVTPAQRDYLLNYVSNQFGLSPEQVAQQASLVPSLNQTPVEEYIPSAQTYQPSQPTYEELLADFQGLTTAEVEKATAPLLEQITGLKGQLAGTEAARQQDFEQAGMARQAFSQNTARSQVGNNFLIQPASQRTSSSSADSFKIRGRRSATGARPADVLPSAVNI